MDIDIRTEPVAFIKEAVEFLGVSRQCLHEWRKQGKIQEYRYGSTGRVCFKWSDLQAVKESRNSGK